jgi:hypothetical protein
MSAIVTFRPKSMSVSCRLLRAKPSSNGPKSTFLNPKLTWEDLSKPFQSDGISGY